MQTRTILLSLLTSTLFWAACDVEDGASELPGGDAGVRGKADGPAFGSCLDGTSSACGTSGIGSCFCDDECHTFGDCCDDKVDICGGPTTELCQGLADESACSQREDCEWAVIPAFPVDFHGCVDAPAEPEFCQELADESACSQREDCEWAIIPAFPVDFQGCVDAPADCDDLAELQCSQRPDCQWNESAFFPSPDPFCSDASESCTDLGELECSQRLDCFWNESPFFPSPDPTCEDKPADPCLGLDDIDCSQRQDCQWTLLSSGFEVCLDA